MGKLTKLILPLTFIVSFLLSYWLIYFFLKVDVHQYGNKNDLNDLTLWMLKWVKHDGYEIQFMLLITCIYFLFIFIFCHLLFQKYVFFERKKIIYSFVLFIYFSTLVYLYTHLEFKLSNYLVILFFIPILLIKKNNKYTNFLFSFFLCFSSILIFFHSLPSFFDYSYFIGPANKLLNSYSLNSFYFQYNLLTIIIFYLMIVFKLKIVSMHFVMFCIFLFWVFVLYRYIGLKYFKNKRFVGTFLICIIVFRGLIIDGGPISLPQSSTLRLDLWVLCLISINKFGFSNFKSALIFSLIYMFDDSFGLLYLILYSVVSLFYTINNYKVNYRHIYFTIPIFLSLSAHYFYFNSILSKSANLYASYGFGFENISTSSIYWIIISIMMFCFYLLVLKKVSLYFVSFIFGLLLIQLVYFFGRSVDNNLYSISGIFLFIIFFALSLFELKNKLLINSSILLLFLFISNRFYNLDNIYENIFRFKHHDKNLANLDSLFLKYDKKNIYIISDKAEIYNYKYNLQNSDIIIPFFANISNVGTKALLIDKLNNNQTVLIEKNTDNLKLLIRFLEQNNFKLIEENELFFKLSN